MPGTCAGVPRLTPRRHALCRRRPAVMSLLKAMFGDARATSLSDLIEGSLILKFNKATSARPRKRRWRRLLAPTSHAYPKLLPPYLHPAAPAVSCELGRPRRLVIRHEWHL